MNPKIVLPRNIFQRILGIPATAKPKNPDCFSFENGVFTIYLDKAPELDRPGGALRVEGGGAPFRLLVIRDDEGQFRAFENRCSHLGHRRMDPVPGAGTIQCCSVNKSTYGYDGKVLSGPAPKPLNVLKVEKKGNTLLVSR